MKMKTLCLRLCLWLGWRIVNNTSTNSSSSNPTTSNSNLHPPFLRKIPHLWLHKSHKKSLPCLDGLPNNAATCDPNQVCRHLLHHRSRSWLARSEWTFWKKSSHLNGIDSHIAGQISFRLVLYLDVENMRTPFVCTPTYSIWEINSYTAHVRYQLQ